MPAVWEAGAAPVGFATLDSGKVRGPQQHLLWCAACGVGDTETWHSLTWSLPEARAFWREYPRMRFLPAREVEFAGSPAVVTGFESLTAAARLEVVALRDTLEVVRINGAAYAELREDG